MMEVLATLAAYRLAKLVVIERGPFDVGTKIRSLALRWSNYREDGLLFDGVTCMWCMSFWFALLCWALVTWGGKPGRFLVVWWGIAGGALIADELISATGEEEE